MRPVGPFDVSESNPQVEESTVTVPPEYRQLVESMTYDELIKDHRDKAKLIGEKSSRLVASLGPHTVLKGSFREPIQRVQETVALGKMQLLIEEQCKLRFPDEPEPRTRCRDVGRGMAKGLAHGIVAIVKHDSSSE